MRKGEATRHRIVTQGMELASEVGLDALTIGDLAKRLGMSKSSMYAHFSTKEDIQLAVIEHSVSTFHERAVFAAELEPPGNLRLRTFFQHWLEWIRDGLPGGDPLLGAATEFDDREDSPIRASLVGHARRTNELLMEMVRASIEVGHLGSELDPEQFVFDLTCITHGYHYYERLLRDPFAERRAISAFERLLGAYAPTE